MYSGLLVVRGFILFYIVVWLGLFSPMREHVVVYSSERRIGRVVYGSLPACFLGLC